MKFLKCKMVGILIFLLLICSCAKEEEQKDCSKIESDFDPSIRTRHLSEGAHQTVEKYKFRYETTAVMGQAYIDIVKCLKESPACNEALKKLGQFYIVESQFNLARYKSWKAYYEAFDVWAEAPWDSNERAKAAEDKEKANELLEKEIEDTPYSSFHKTSSDNEARKAIREANVDVIKHCSQKTREIVKPAVEY